MGFILAPIALILFALIGFIHSIVTIVINISRRAFFRNVSKIKYRFAFDVDVFGNYLFADTWNLLFCKKGVKEFGIFGESLSSVLGRLRRDLRYNWFGFVFSLLLDVIWLPDWLKGGHCKASIMSPIEININRKMYK